MRGPSKIIYASTIAPALRRFSAARKWVNLLPPSQQMDTAVAITAGAIDPGERVCNCYTMMVPSRYESPSYDEAT